MFFKSVLQKNEQGHIRWNESPEPDEGKPLDLSLLTPARKGSGEPLYENHHPSAQQAWQSLHQRSILKETTRTESDGCQMHVELAQAAEGLYLYCANTFDQRQLVIVEPARGAMLEAYYQEIIGETS